MKREYEPSFRGYALFGKYLCGLIHSFRSKLMAVYGVTELILRDGDSSSRSHAELQSSALSQILTMLDRYMFFVRTEAISVMEMIDLHAAIQSIIEIFKNGIALKHGIQIRYLLEGPLYIKGPPNEVFQVFEHILQNAIDAVSSSEEKQIHISSVIRPPYARIDVDDSGSGLPWCISCHDWRCLDCKCFSVGTSRKKNGTGLGMVWVQEGLKMMGGDLAIDSRLKGGTTISLLFPMQ